MNDFLVIGDLRYAHRIRINNYCDIRVEEMVYGSPNSYLVLCSMNPASTHEVARIDGFYLSKMFQVDFPNDEQYGRSEGPECSF